MNLKTTVIEMLPGRRWDAAARWAPVPLRLIVGYGFMEHGFAKLARGPEDFATILHTDQAPRQVGEPRFHLAACPLLPQHDGTAVIMTHDVERVLADIDADHGCRCVEFLRHGVLLVLSAPWQLLVLARPEHGRTIPLSDNRLASTLSEN